MRIPNSVYYALSLCAALDILAGCSSGGSQLAPPSPVQQTTAAAGSDMRSATGVSALRAVSRPQITCPPPSYELLSQATAFETGEKVALVAEKVVYGDFRGHSFRRMIEQRARWTSSGGDLDVINRGRKAIFSASVAGQYLVTAEFDGQSRAVTLAAQIHNERLLFSFGCSSCGVTPEAGLLAGIDGTFFDTTGYGGNASCGCGVAFKLTPRGSNYEETILHDFQSGSDGANPSAPLIADAGGALFGTTWTGGSNNGEGTVFRLTPNGSGYEETILHVFQQNGIDGLYPNAGLTAGKKGALYGTTVAGGTTDSGTVFRLTPNGSGYDETVLYSFPGGRKEITANRTAA